MGCVVGYAFWNDEFLDIELEGVDENIGGKRLVMHLVSLLVVSDVYISNHFYTPIYAVYMRHDP